MQLIIHRGSKQIGGSCVEISTPSARIIIDVGLPLDDVVLEVEHAARGVDRHAHPLDVDRRGASDPPRRRLPPVGIHRWRSDQRISPPPVDSRLRVGYSACPYCFNDVAASCGTCNSLFCLPSRNPPSELVCPSCSHSISRGNQADGGFMVSQSTG